MDAEDVRVIAWQDATESANILMKTRGRHEWGLVEYEHAKMIFRRLWGAEGVELDVERRYTALNDTQEVIHATSNS